MRVFVYEFITGGGLGSGPLPASLAREGEMMVHALARDLSAVPGIELVIARDRRLPSAPPPAATLRADGRESPRETFQRGLRMCDAAWPIAPETGGALESLSLQTLEAGRMLLASRPEAVHTAASKLVTTMVLDARGIAAVPTFADPSRVPPLRGAWVVKPDEGAGCEDTWLLPGADHARRWLSDHPGHIAQPWIEGEALSLSLVCSDGAASLLSVNRQRVSRGERLALAGIEVNARPDSDGSMARLGNAIARALPDLWGYVGVDLVDTPSGPMVLEINPRLTTSYCGIADATGINPAELVLNLAEGHPLADHGPIAPRLVDLRLEASLAH